MGIDFLGLKTLFGTASMNGTWWYMSAAVIFILLVPLVMKLEDCLPMVLALVVAFPHIVMLDMARETDVYTFIPVFLMGMCVAKYDLLERWLRVWNKIPQRVVKFLLELLVLFLFYIKHMEKYYHFYIMRSDGEYSRSSWLHFVRNL